MRAFIHCLVPCALLGLVSPSVSLAAFEQAPLEDEPYGLTITVTARLIPENAQTVPVSVVSVSPTQLQTQGITSTQQLQETVAGLFVTAPNPRLTSIYIRGLGSYPFNEGLENSVALFLDGVYLGRSGMSIGDLIDIERIEVARGPQGTLFGKNSTAGTISVFTRKPTFTPEADLEITAGDLGTLQLRSSFSDALSSTLAGRFTAYHSSRDGLVLNRFDNEKVNGISRQGGRGQLLWLPSADFSARLIAEASLVDESCCSLSLLGEPRASVRASDEYMGYQRVSGDPADREGDTDVSPNSRVEQQALSLETKWHIDDIHRLITISAIRHYDFVPTTDDNTSLKLVQGGTFAAHWQWSEEARLESRWAEAETVLGAYLLAQETTGRESGLLGSDLSDWVFGGLIREQVPTATQQNTGLVLHALIPRATLDGMRVETPFEQQAISLASFGSINWHATEQLDLSAGLRVTQEWKATDVRRSRSGGNPSASPLALSNNLQPLNALLGTNLPSFNQLLDETAGGEFERKLDLQELAVSGQLGVSYFWQPDVMAYLTLSRGVKSGGINLGVTGPVSDPVFRPEIAHSAELGLKLQGWEQRLMLNMAIYYARIQDYQSVTFDESPTFIPNPRLNNLLNVGQVTSQGVDVDFLLSLPWQVSVRGGLSFNDAVTDEFTNAPDEDSRSNTKDLSGQPLANAPHWQGNLAISKDWLLNSQLVSYASANYWFRSSFNATFERSRATEIDGYGVLGGRVGIRDAKSSWDASLWVRNALNETYITGVTALYGVGDYGAYAGEPRIIGTTLRLKFR